jgi:radical SAM superfamily enzyme YgiQ (UPF0313 family)
MRALLVQSYLGGGEPLVYPIGLACIKAAAEARGHEARIFDMNAAARPFEGLAAAIGDFRPHAVGISLRNIDSTNKRRVVFYYGRLKETVRAVRGATDARIVVGGSGFSMFAEDVMRDEPGVDMGVYLEGEETFPELLDNLDSPELVKGVYYRKDGRPVFTGARGPVDVNSTPPAVMTSLDMAPYRDVPDSIGIETKRGCMLRCVYCIYGFLNGRQIRLKEPARVVDEIESLVKSTGVRRFTFVDAVFNIPEAHAEAVCREIIKRGLGVEWSAWLHEERLTGAFLRLARDAGLRKAIFSPDGFSEETLKRLGKGLKKEHIMRSYAVVKETEGIEVCYNFFKNPPGQDMRALLSLMRFFVKAKLAMRGRVHFEFNSMRIEPHTALHRMAMNEGLLGREDRLLYPRYYTNPGTAYIEGFFNLLLRLKGA